ncbi:MAG: DUF4338 domain-containing protein, partial [Pseudomonadota bacterium]|nr:DUF4338 domain-containing protein [Pseudomonadota bacterium]
PEDFAARYGERPVLLETFVQIPRFRGTCYRAANWQYLVLSLRLFHRQFPKMFRSISGRRSHIDRTGGIALEDGGIWESSDLRSQV